MKKTPAVRSSSAFTVALPLLLCSAALADAGGVCSKPSGANDPLGFGTPQDRAAHFSAARNERATLSVGQAEYDTVRELMRESGAGVDGRGYEIGAEERAQVQAIERDTLEALSGIGTEQLPEQLGDYLEHTVGDDIRLTKEQPPSSRSDQGDGRIHHQLMISSSIPETQRRALIKELARQQALHPEARVAAYLQGPPDGLGLDEAMREVQGWLRDAGFGLADDNRPDILMDNKVYDRHGVQAVPTWVSTRDGEVIARGEGVGLEYILEQAQSLREEGESPDVGRLGQVWEIAEPHFTEEFVPQRLAQWIEQQGGEEQILADAKAAFWSHQPFRDLHLTPAQERHSYIVDPTVTVTETIRDPLSELVIAHKGEQFNPFDIRPFTQELVVFDATRPEQVRWVREWLQARERESGQRPLAITSNLDTSEDGWAALKALNSTLDQNTYLLEPDLQKRLGLRHTPSIVAGAHAGTRLSVEEIPVAELSDLGRLWQQGSGAAQELSQAVSEWLFPAAVADTPTLSMACNDAGFFGSMLSDVCWDCHLPWSMGGADQGGDAPPGFNDNPICMCDPPWPGMTVGAWLPSRAIEFVRVPYCSPMMSGQVLDIGTGAHEMYSGGRNTETGSDTLTFYHHHYWTFPAGEVLGILLGCEPGPDTIDMMYMSEVDPSWNNDQVALITTPEVALFATVLAQLPCAGEAAAIAAGSTPISELFWCAGSWGSLYPFTGFTNHDNSPVRDVALLGTRALAALARKGFVRNAAGDACSTTVMPQIIKENFRWQHLFPLPEANSTHWTGEEPIGSWGEHRNIPVDGEDYLRLLWRWTDCCMEL